MNAKKLKMDNPKISVCIPAYEMGGNGVAFLTNSFSRLAQQDFKDFEVVVSDQSANSEVHSLCESWSAKFRIRHFWNLDGAKQSSANTNHAMNMADGSIIKVLFQDDFLCDSGALSKTFEALSASDANWLLCGSGVTRDGKSVEDLMVPRLTPTLHFGKNTVSSPSVLAVKRSCHLKFDENLIWLMDVEMYKRLWDNLGEPAIVSEALVANYIHGDQVSASVDKSIKLRELKYVWEKHRDSTTGIGKIEYLKRRAKIGFSTNFQAAQTKRGD